MILVHEYYYRRVLYFEAYYYRRSKTPQVDNFTCYLIMPESITKRINNRVAMAYIQHISTCFLRNMWKLKLINDAPKENSDYNDAIMVICNLEVAEFSIAPLFSISFHFAFALMMTNYR